MSRKKKLDVGSKKLYLTLLILLIVLIVLMTVLLTKKLLYSSSGKDYFTTESRVEKVSNYVFKNDSNYKTVGWLRVQGTNLDYPIVFYKDYFENRYPVEEESYLWMTGKTGEFSNSMNFDGHNIFNLGADVKKSSDEFKRSEELMSFVYYDFAKDNLYMQLTMDGKEYIYKIFSSAFIDSFDSSLFAGDGYDDKEDFKEHINVLLDESIYDYSVDVNTDDKIISVRTCSSFYDNSMDFVVSARLLRDGEKADWYRVKRNKNYVKVDETLKGVDLNEEEV